MLLLLVTSINKILFDIAYYWRYNQFENTPPRGIVNGVIKMMADKAYITKLLRTARGQIDGILKMVDEDRYCIEISHQLMAAEAMLNKINKEILTAHLKHCVSNAQTQEEQDEKIDELVSMLGKIMK